MHGACAVGIESTIVDLTRLDTDGPVLLRPGQVSVQELEQVLGRSLAMSAHDAPRVSGSLDAHYAPQTPLVLVETDNFVKTLAELQAKQRQVASLRVSTNPQAYAHDLYAQLRSLDRLGADVILVEQPPGSTAWQGINDRLRRAAFDSVGVLERLLA